METNLINNTKELFREAFETMRKKNADYSRHDDDGLGNFRLSANIAGIPMSKGILIRLSDKLARIGNIMDGDAKVKEESVFDTIQDGINYLAILYYAIKKEEEEISKNKEQESSERNSSKVS